MEAQNIAGLWGSPQLAHNMRLHHVQSYYDAKLVNTKGAVQEVTESGHNWVIIDPAAA